MTRVKIIVGVALLVGLSLLIGIAARCDEDSFAADKMVLSYYSAINDGDTARAQSYVSPANPNMLELTEALVSVMAGKIQKVEVLDTARSEGVWGGLPTIGVVLRITCDPGVPQYAPGYPQTWSSGKTCGDVAVFLYEYGSGWKIGGTD